MAVTKQSIIESVLTGGSDRPEYADRDVIAERILTGDGERPEYRDADVIRERILGRSS